MRVISTHEEMNAVAGGKFFSSCFLKANAKGAISGIMAGMSTGGALQNPGSHVKWGAIAGLLNNKFAGGVGYIVFR